MVLSTATNVEVDKCRVARLGTATRGLACGGKVGAANWRKLELNAKEGMMELIQGETKSKAWH